MLKSSCSMLLIAVRILFKIEKHAVQPLPITTACHHVHAQYRDAFPSNAGKLDCLMCQAHKGSGIKVALI